MIAQRSSGLIGCDLSRTKSRSGILWLARAVADFGRIAIVAVAPPNQSAVARGVEDRKNLVADFLRWVKIALRAHCVTVAEVTLWLLECVSTDRQHKPAWRNAERKA